MHLLGEVPSIAYKYYTRLERLASDKGNGLFDLFISDKEKKFYNLDNRFATFQESFWISMSWQPSSRPLSAGKCNSCSCDPGPVP
jgi:hypothetical protein